jgi:hypothetical protein
VGTAAPGDGGGGGGPGSVGPLEVAVRRWPLSGLSGGIDDGRRGRARRTRAVTPGASSVWGGSTSPATLRNARPSPGSCAAAASSLLRYVLSRRICRVRRPATFGKARSPPVATGLSAGAMVATRQTFVARFPTLVPVGGGTRRMAAVVPGSFNVENLFGRPCRAVGRQPPAGWPARARRQPLVRWSPWRFGANGIDRGLGPVAMPVLGR